MKTYYISAGAIFGTMAVVVRILGIKLPFPPIPYLTFELAEIPIILGFLFLPNLETSFIDLLLAFIDFLILLLFFLAIIKSDR
jgi:riboflavin transporter FmnP